jgi:hypothetical protein
MHMNCARLACVAGTLVFLVGCSGTYKVGQEATNGGGSPATSGGESSSVAGASVASAGDANGDTPSGGAPNGVGGGEISSAGTAPLEGTGGDGRALTPPIVYCGQTLPTFTSTIALAAPQLVWTRVQLFLLGATSGSPPMLPATTTRQWAGSLVDSMLDSLKTTSAPGLTNFVNVWWPGTPNAEAWAALFGDSKGTLTDLLTTTSVTNPGSGVLTDLAVLVQTDISLRGIFVNEHLRCKQVPPPPPGIPALGPEAPGQTRRAQLEQAVAVPTCTICHSLMDPIGDSLENYDTVGMFNTLDNGLPIDTAGTLLATDAFANDITFANVNELGEKLAQECEVSQCLTQQLLADAEASAKLPATGSANPQAVAQIAYASPSGKLRDLIRNIVESDTFLRAK